MARTFRTQPKSSKGLRLLVVTGLASVVYHIGAPTFSVKGGWDGEVADIKTFPRGLGVDSVSGLALSQQTGGGSVRLAVEDGHLVARYSEGPLSLQADDEQSWQANFTKPDTSIRARGDATNDFSWDISKTGRVGGLGDVQVNVSSEPDFGNFGVSVEPSMLHLIGTQLKASAHSHEGDIQARMEAQRQLAKNVALTYAVENEEGNYDLDQLSHSARLKAQFGDESDSGIDVRLSGNKDDQLYNATLTHNFGKRLRGNADTMLGVDNDGVYGALDASRAVSKSLTAGYKGSGRWAFGSEGDSANLRNDVSLSHALGNLTLSQSTDGPMSALVESDVRRGPMHARARVLQSLSEKAAPEFNVSLNSDLGRVLPGVDLLIGLDDPSEEGVYGQLTARRNLGKHANVEYSSSGRINNMEHWLKVANDIGFAKFLKRPDSAPRVQLGYQFEV